MRHFITFQRFKWTAFILAVLCVSQPAYAQQPLSVQILSAETTKLGGLHNFSFDILDADKLRQLYGGRELDIFIEPVWDALQVNIAGNSAIEPRKVGIYRAEITVRDALTDALIAAYETPFKDTDPRNDPIGAFSEDAALWTGQDTVGISVNSSTLKEFRSGSFTSVDPLLHTPDQMEFDASLRFGFDYVLQQFGGIYRAETANISSGVAQTNVGFNPNVLRTEPIYDTVGNVVNIIGGIGHNLGPINYEIEFLPGGTESIETIVNLGSIADPSLDTVVFECEYLTMRITNTISFEHTDRNGNPIFVSYPDEVPHANVQPANWFGGSMVLVRDVPVDAYNLSAYSWRNGRENDGFMDRSNQHHYDASPRGTQGRYYLSARNGDDIVDFVHIFSAAGTQFLLDFANKGSNKRAPRIIPRSQEIPTEDFKVGDKVFVSTFGGALGLPLPGAKLRVRIDTTVTSVAEQFSDTKYRLQATPMPAQADFRIAYTLNRPRNVALAFYDAFGRRVAWMLQGFQTAGNYSTGLRAQDFSAGLYICELQTDGTAAARIPVMLTPR